MRLLVNTRVEVGVIGDDDADARYAHELFIDAFEAMDASRREVEKLKALHNTERVMAETKKADRILTFGDAEAPTEPAMTSLPIYGPDGNLSGTAVGATWEAQIDALGRVIEAQRTSPDPSPPGILDGADVAISNLRVTETEPASQ